MKWADPATQRITLSESVIRMFFHTVLLSHHRTGSFCIRASQGRVGLHCLIIIVVVSAFPLLLPGDEHIYLYMYIICMSENF